MFSGIIIGMKKVAGVVEGDGAVAAVSTTTKTTKSKTRTSVRNELKDPPSSFSSSSHRSTPTTTLVQPLHELYTKGKTQNNNNNNNKHRRRHRHRSDSSSDNSSSSSSSSSNSNSSNDKKSKKKSKRRHHSGNSNKNRRRTTNNKHDDTDDTDSENNNNRNNKERNNINTTTTKRRNHEAVVESRSQNDTNNLSVAEQLRQKLVSTTTGSPLLRLPPQQQQLEEKAINRNNFNRTAVDDLVNRGRISSSQQKTNGDANDDTTSTTVFVKVDDPKMVRSNVDDMTIQDMIMEERIQQKNTMMNYQFGTMNDAEEEARNAIRLGKKRRYKENNNNNNKNMDSDEEERRQMENISSFIQQTKPKKQQQKQQQQDIGRQIQYHDKITQLTSKCWWWLDCGSHQFQQHRLLSLGNYVSLLLAPIQYTLKKTKQQRHGQQQESSNYYPLYYIVPIPHVESLASCTDENIWNEIQYYQNSLRELYNNDKKDDDKTNMIIFYETIASKNVTSSFWQTKLECLVVPKKIGQDTSLYFQSALQEMSNEWGTHRKLMKTCSRSRTGSSSSSSQQRETTMNSTTTVRKDLTRTVPNRYPYFYIEYNDQGDGYVQLIEDDNTGGGSTTFPTDFAINTIANMLHIDPIRFHHKHQEDGSSSSSSSSTILEKEKRLVIEFLENWKTVDWTTSLE